MHGLPMYAVAAATMMMLAGCTGGFEIEQTEPIRVQVDGEPERTTVRDSEPEGKEFHIEVEERERIEVEVEVTRISDTPTKVKVLVKDGDTVLAERDIDVGDEPDEPEPGNDTEPGNGTGNQTEPTPTPEPTPEPTGQTVIENLTIDVKGKDNVVVVTQAQEGEADVNVAARDASQVSEDDDGNQTVEPTPEPTY